MHPLSIIPCLDAYYKATHRKNINAVREHERENKNFALVERVIFKE